MCKGAVNGWDDQRQVNARQMARRRNAIKLMRCDGDVRKRASACMLLMVQCTVKVVLWEKEVSLGRNVG